MSSPAFVVEMGKAQGSDKEGHKRKESCVIEAQLLESFNMVEGIKAG